ncbi:MAG TPA: hypothetical protein VGN79_11680 [Devosia sp.]|jgi:hypothetical protein|nr:hypothetical protein [Devosia sp.]
MKIRAATYADAEAGAQVLQRSIAELCRADHNDNDTVLAAWTANKTPRNWKIWVDQNEIELFVAVASDQVAGVGMLDHA